jgi:hypothetical protein
MKSTLGCQLLAVGCWLLAAGCRQVPVGSPIGSTYQTIARPAVWRVLPRSQADRLGLKPGDLIVSYQGEPVQTVDDLLHLQGMALADTVSAGAKIPLTILRDDTEVEYAVAAGSLGIIADVDRYTSSLAVALGDLLSNSGSVVDYDWLAAATGESFSFTASEDECGMDWNGALAGAYLEDLAPLFGLSFRPVFVSDTTDSVVARIQSDSQAVPAIKDELERGRTPLVLADWSGDRFSWWGIVTSWDPDDSLLYGFAAGTGGETPVTGTVQEAYEVRCRAVPEIDAARLLTEVLTRALELGQAYADSGWQSGVAAYDIWIARLDSVPFCPVCGTASQACFDNLVWSLTSSKESANRFLLDMREALPDQADLIDEIRADNDRILAKLAGIVASGVTVGTPESQEKLARVIAEIQLIEVDLLGLYEELIGEL